MTEKKTSVNDDGIYEPFPIDDVPREDFSHGERFKVRYKQLGEYGGCSNVGVCMEELEGGKRAYPAHYHMLEEEHLSILEQSLNLQVVRDSG